MISVTVISVMRAISWRAGAAVHGEFCAHVSDHQARTARSLFYRMPLLH
jgi:hypothetical protein